MAGDFVWSTDQENYSSSDEFETREAAVADAVAELAGGERSRFWTGRKRPPNVAASFDVNDVLEHLSLRAADEDPSGDYSSDWPGNPKKGGESETALRRATDAFNDAIDAWVEKHDTPTWFTVDEIEEHATPDAGEKPVTA